MDVGTILIVGLAGATLYFSRMSDAKETASMIAKLNANIENLAQEVSRLNAGVEVLTLKTNDFNRDIALLDQKVTAMHNRLDRNTEELKNLENEVHGGDSK